MKDGVMVHNKWLGSQLDDMFSLIRDGYGLGNYVTKKEKGRTTTRPPC
jgi:hypothetical protein